jgi:hypothetical protein
MLPDKKLRVEAKPTTLFQNPRRFAEDVQSTKLLQKHPYCSNVQRLAEIVYEYLDYLVSDIPYVSEQNVNCEERRYSYALPMHEQLLSTLGNCVNMPNFNMRLDQHSLSEWMMIYAAAMQCGIESCGGTGWLQFRFNDHEQHWGHITAMYFDRERKLQVFFIWRLVCIITNSHY